MRLASDLVAFLLKKRALCYLIPADLLYHRPRGGLRPRPGRRSQKRSTLAAEEGDGADACDIIPASCDLSHVTSVRSGLSVNLSPRIAFTTNCVVGLRRAVTVENSRPMAGTRYARTRATEWMLVRWTPPPHTFCT